MLLSPLTPPFHSSQALKYWTDFIKSLRDRRTCLTSNRKLLSRSLQAASVHLLATGSNRIPTHNAGDKGSPGRFVTRGTSQIRVLFRLWLTAVGLTATFPLARIFPLATVVARLAAALSLTVILAFTRVFALFRLQRLNGNACLGRSGARGIGTSGD